MTATDDHRSTALDSIRVLDFTQMMLAPYATRFATEAVGR